MSSFTNAHTRLRLALDFSQAMFVTEGFEFYVGDKVLPNHIIYVPEGFYSDGISTFWKLTNRWYGIQKWGPYAAAGVLHDFLYAEHQRLNMTRKEADRIFRTACKVLGCPSWKANLATIGLTLGGWFPWWMHNMKRKMGKAQAWDKDHETMLWRKDGLKLVKVTQKEFNEAELIKEKAGDHA